jgi:regulator of protease activity HflC (stomatin/prohibitin superfamily)
MTAINTQSSEIDASSMSGWLGLPIVIAMPIGAVALFVTSLKGGADAISWWGLLGAAALLVTSLICLRGFFTLQPNEARVLILFGRYKGTVREAGFHFANPFYALSRGVAPGAVRAGGIAQLRSAAAQQGTTVGALRPMLPTKLSLRARNFNSEVLKVNDKRGNPVEIAAVVVWRIDDTAQAVFDVEDFGSYVEVQSESAIRSIASRYAYDHGEEHEMTLRGGADVVAQSLKEELELRLAKAGVAVEEARLTHLAYAPEIAPVMLRRQQAEAIVAARQIIVHNAVSMVQMALADLAAKNVVTLDEERKAAMVSNLLVVLCGSNEASPVINTGTLYS